MTYNFHRVEFEWSIFGVEKVIVSTNAETGIGKILADIEKRQGSEEVIPEDVALAGYSKSINDPRVYSTTPQVGLYPIILNRGVPYLKKIKKVEPIPHDKVTEMGLNI